MNPTSADPSAPPPPPPPSQPPRSSFSCDRHPTEQFTGFCPSCLCERLTTLDQSSSNTPSSSRRPSSASAAAAAAIKSLFSSSNAAKPNNLAPPPPPPQAPKPSKPSSFFPELRRTKSFSASKNEALGLAFEPQRKSCDVRARGTLSSLFTLDDGTKIGPSTSQLKIESFVANKQPVFEETENEEDYRDPENLEDDVIVCDDDDGDEIRPVRDTHLESLGNSVEIETNSGEIVEEEVVESVAVILKPMKDHIDVDNQEKKSSGGGFWAAASVFSKKWHKWRRKQKIKKPSNHNNFATLPVEKPISRQFRETQSEIADYGFGRRSCDTDPRFSLDAGRISFDDPRYSFDEPRASWDGYMIGKSFPRMAGPTMVSVLEDAPVPRSDMQIPVEEVNSVNCVVKEGDGGAVENSNLPGGSMQTRDYYLDSSSRRRKSLDRSSSMRKSAVSETDEFKLVSNARVSPTTADCYQGAKVMLGENNILRDSNSNSLREDCSETFELGSNNGFIRDSSNSLDKKESKKSRRWSWRIWGFNLIHRRNNNSNKDEGEDEKYNGRANGVERSLSESWQDMRTENGDLRGRLNRNMFRSNSSVSWRNNGNIVGGSFGSMRKSSVEANGNNRKDEFVLERNRSARYSPNDVDNGLLRFYLTPMKNSRRGGGLAKIKPNNSHSIARSVLRLY
ncbi:hypothetical protein CASFOL_033429 [Castilleja foliolosa]|uniref:Uncharacterized protein n=1 Tax=Castilleja foliolosa TaxID=1961234 RepID=A0ABD3BZB4_9LAMI